jgi:hypothetical protein
MIDIDERASFARLKRRITQALQAIDGSREIVHGSLRLGFRRVV